MGSFIQTAWTDPVYYFSVVIIVIVSVVLHELGHGVAAIWQGDDTPIRLQRLTPNPLVHMGYISLIALFLVGIAWGAMPVNPQNFKHRYSNFVVLFAGPAVNLALALIAFGITAVWLVSALADDPVSRAHLHEALSSGSASLLAGDWVSQSQFLGNLFLFCQYAVVWNVVLFLFNLMPIPPLDGGRIACDLVPEFNAWVNNPDSNAGTILMVAFLGLFFFGAEYLWRAGFWVLGQGLAPFVAF